jgi:voltage-gated potassium channel
MHPFRRLLPALVLLLIIAATGVAGYMLIEGWTFLESAYMVVITLFTIGFEEVEPLSRAGMVFTIFIILTGVSTAIYAAGKAVEIMIEGEMSGYQKRKRMEKKISELKNHYIICGFGRVGHQVAQAFEASKVPFVVVDTKPETAGELENLNVPNIFADATSDEALLRAGIKTAKGLVACSDSDVANVYVTLSARALNPRLHIIARAGLRDTEKKLLMAGADRVISPYFISGLRMASLATRPIICDFLDLVSHGGQVEFSLYEINIPHQSSLAGKNLSEANIREISGALVLAIRKSSGIFDLQPKASSTIDPGDVLVVLGTADQIERLEKMIA